MLDKLQARYQMGTCPDYELVKKAYFGGRIEIFKRGRYKPVYNYDINSAYPTATCLLPKLKMAKWKKVSGKDLLKYDFGIANVSWSPGHKQGCDCGCKVIGPFPYRGDKNSDYMEDSVIFPLVFSTYGSGAYHLVEIKAALKKNLWNIELGSGLVIDNGYEK